MSSPSPPTLCCPPGPALGVGASPTAQARAGRHGPRQAWARPPKARPASRSDPAGRRPRPCLPRRALLPPHGLPRRPRGAARPRPHARAHAAPAASAAFRGPRHRLTTRGCPSRCRTPGPGRACAPRATQSDGPVAARRRRVGTGSAAAGPAPSEPTGGHFRSRGVERGCWRGRAWSPKKRPACECARRPDPALGRTRNPTPRPPGAPCPAIPVSPLKTPAPHLETPANPRRLGRIRPAPKPRPPSLEALP